MLTMALHMLLPNPAGAVWIGLLVWFLVYGDFRRWLAPRNVWLAGLLLLAVFLMDVSRWDSRPDSPTARYVFTAIYLLTAGYTALSLSLMRREPAEPWAANLPERGLRLLVPLLLALNLTATFGRPPDDSGYYSNLGAQRFAETGVLPYGDAKLKGPNAPAYGAAATYGPVLYLAHIPAQWLLGASRNSADANPMDPSYVRPPNLATQLTCFAFYLVGLGALFVLVRRLRDTTTALGALALYMASPYVFGLGGEHYVIGGMAYISHIAPSSVMLLALATASRPALSGALLAAAAGVLFYPLFMFPAWFGWRLWRGDRPWRFAAGFAATGLLIAAFVVYFTHAPPGENPIRLVLQSTLEHQEGTRPLEYGASHFGFWGTHPQLAAFWQRPLFGDTSLFKPTFLLFASFSLGALFLARGRSLPQLAALTAALGAGVQLWKTHAAGSYVEWYLPFLLVALLGAAGRDAQQDSAP